MDLLHPDKLIETFGTLGLILVVFAESGLFFGFFLPGDSLLITAGVFAAKGDLQLPVIIVGVFVAAVAGDQVGYIFGRRAGPALFRKPDSRFFKQSHVEKARLYFAEHGPKTIVLARFVPFVRTFAPIVAGVGRMHYPTFVAYNVLGGLLWGVGVTTVGYLLGEAFDVDRYLLPIIGVIVAVSLVPVLREALRARRSRARAE
ncbi:MAG: DedA family protein [Actinomycetota bacterium]|nr:DedA family protein [Actinomycetota bacterium]